MQDKETVDDPEEALTIKADITRDRQPTPDKKDSSEGKKASNKDGNFAFRKMKTPKKDKTEKPDKNSPSRYEGEKVVFKAKLIGLEPVSDARGDKMCQEAMQRLKLNVRSTGPHKRKINICVSLEGIKIKDEKSGAAIHHHPVSYISFISQDITDARAFGYVFGSTTEPHQFIAIKTEKPAFHVVLALRDLFQAVLHHKQEEIDNVKDQNADDSKPEKTDAFGTKENQIADQFEGHITQDMDTQAKDENIYFEVLLTEPIAVVDEGFVESKKEPVKTIDDLLGLQSEANKLQEGIIQMDTSIAAAAVFNAEVPAPESDPFDTSFVLGHKRDSFPFPMPTPVQIHTPATTSENLPLEHLGNGDKYAVFNVIDSSPSIFEAPENATTGADTADLRELEEEIARKAAPAKPPRLTKTASSDVSLFADLDPLGKDRPYKDKAEFFQDVKNPPKKVLNDLVDPSKESGALSTSVPFPVDFESMSSPSFVNSPPSSNRLLTESNIPFAHSLNRNGERVQNPFENHSPDSSNYISPSNGLEPRYPIGTPGVQVASPLAMNGSNYLGKSTPTSTNLPSSQQPLTVNCSMTHLNNNHLGPQQNSSSCPIPIPSNHVGLAKDRAFSNGSIGSPYSKSPQFYSSESPSNSDSYYNNSEGNSPTGVKNPNQYTNTDNGQLSPNSNNNLTKLNINSFLNNTNTQNGVSRPRPRPSLSKGGSTPNGGRTVSSHSLSSDSSSDYEAISRENMQSITNVLVTNGHRLRAQSLCLDSNNEFKLKLPGEKNIFAKKNDPFADDFFFSLPKKNGHLTSTEIPEYM